MKKTYNIYGMHCSGCVNSAEKALKKVPGVQSASVQLTTEKAVVEFEDGIIPFETLQKAVDEAGYELHVPELKTVTFDIEGMHCAGCTNTVEKAMNRVEGVHNAHVNLASGTATAEIGSSGDIIAEIEKSVQDAGYTVKKKVLTNPGS